MTLTCHFMPLHPFFLLKQCKQYKTNFFKGKLQIGISAISSAQKIIQRMQQIILSAVSKAPDLLTVTA